MNEMSEMKDKIRQALPKGVIVDENVLEKIVGGIQTGMTKTDLEALLEGAGLQTGLLNDLQLAIAKPRPPKIGR
ncbi:MAG: hypothetical protein J5973_08180 [Eubacterium sp.]|nr:hypothetical protein [Eubacterium sp.]